MSDRPISIADFIWGLVGAFILHVVMIALAIAWVALYSLAVAPGHERGFYEAYAQVSSPIVSVIAGGPVFYLAALWLTKRRRTGIATWIAACLYLLLDLGVFIATGSLAGPAAFAFLGGGAIKLAATALAVWRVVK